MTPPARRSLARGSTIDRYRIESELGHGATATVFRAVRAPDGAVVALKVFRADVSDDTVFGRRVAREVRAAGEVAHRHLVPILDVGEADGWRYVVMPYGGRSLAERLTADGRLPGTEAIRIVGHVAAGLDALHAQGIVHRDVKPVNILIDDEDVAALGDFGLSKGREYTALTRPGNVVGTVDYLAPELVRGDDATPATDIYALACVTYECLTGQPPFADVSVLRVGFAHLQQEPPDPCEARPELPSSVGRVVVSALAKDPAARPRSATAYAHMLDVARRDRPA